MKDPIPFIVALWTVCASLIVAGWLRAMGWL